MLSCKQASQLLSHNLDRRLTFSEKCSLKLHLMICKFCARFANQLKLIQKSVRKTTTAIESDNQIRLPQSVHDKVTQAINQSNTV